MVRPADARLRARYEAPLALVRPDQHVAWRGAATPGDVAAVLDVVRGAALPLASAREADRLLEPASLRAGAFAAIIRAPAAA